MDPLLPIFTRSLMGNTGFIITHYEPGQLADANPLSPTKFHDTYFPCSLVSVLQILSRGREQAYETVTRSGASLALRQSRS